MAKLLPETERRRERLVKKLIRVSADKGYSRACDIARVVALPATRVADWLSRRHAPCPERDIIDAIAIMREAPAANHYVAPTRRAELDAAAGRAEPLSNASKEIVRGRLVEISKLFGYERSREILARFGAESVADLKEVDAQAVVAACAAVLEPVLDAVLELEPVDPAGPSGPADRAAFVLKQGASLELGAMTKVAQALEPLTDEERLRVLEWAVSRYGVRS